MCIFIIILYILLFEYIYFRTFSTYLNLQPSTLNIVTLNSSTDIHEYFNIIFAFEFYNPNSKMSLNIRDDIVDLDYGLNKHISSCFHYMRTHD